MFLGGLPRLKLDRTGVALLGAIGMIGLGALDVEGAARSVDLPTLLLLFSFMVMSAQMRLGGFYTACVRQMAALPLSPAAFLGALIALAGGLAAVFSNDVVCLALTPVVVRVSLQRGLHPVPCLVALACAANIGSAATLIGNPQNMLIGSVLGLSFSGYLRQALPPVLLGLGLTWVWLAWGPGRRQLHAPFVPLPATCAPESEPAVDLLQTLKGLSVAGGVLAAFLWSPWPHEVVALVAAGVLLLSRRLHSSQVMGYVDWELLVLFAGLFVVNRAFQDTGLPSLVVQAMAAQGVHLQDTAVLFAVGAGLSNVVSNVPAVMLLLPHVQGLQAQQAGLTLALVTTLAGNLLLVGSMANLIVADLAAAQGVRLDAWTHARLGAPVAVLSLAGVAAWLAG
ncbi:anion transporter [Ideonella sp. TBM-1]|uniref:Anion transporter n=2 Tax=Ideonella livida TaxID=2707176 RepID=A0A7C9PJP4_9BURK|nr:anion transporter [Ideonella livida]